VSLVPFISLLSFLSGDFVSFLSFYIEPFPSFFAYSFFISYFPPFLFLSPLSKPSYYQFVLFFYYCFTGYYFLTSTFFGGIEKNAFDKINI
jgi:hypothetical protein